ncbi:hypothetical protein O181_082010 [Austropuccinia psidii MF-1]|uniref:Uncharacterized protein n=1 Tax=Austropuccinia psidii MF-1 TaxID=1389203 RepID=A0A9Q3FK60_9BASI|nr:hypothetical protein [Austropuccinia psidii MF-1]
MGFKCQKSPATRHSDSLHALQENSTAPDGWRTYSVNPPNTMSHLFQAQVHPLNHMRMFQLVSLKSVWLQCINQRNLLVSTFPFFCFFPVPKFPSPLLGPSSAHPTTCCLVIIINNIPVGCTPLPPSSPIPNPTPPVPSSSTPTLVPSLESPPIAPRTQTPTPLIPTMRLGRSSST